MMFAASTARRETVASRILKVRGSPSGDCPSLRMDASRVNPSSRSRRRNDGSPTTSTMRASRPRGNLSSVNRPPRLSLPTRLASNPSTPTAAPTRCRDRSGSPRADHRGDEGLPSRPSVAVARSSGHLVNHDGCLNGEAGHWVDVLTHQPEAGVGHRHTDDARQEGAV